jgi:peptidoglycan/LPS O-acetylase OafA/YrhL
VARKRLPEIDAVRGIAAATVVAWHSLLIFPSIGADTRAAGLTWLNVVKYSPLRAVFAGPQAVLLFFVISGFVLSLPLLGERRPDYRRFFIRRVARIWPAYAVACLCAFAATAAAGNSRIDRLSPWFNSVWQRPVTPGAVAHHLILVDRFPTGSFDPVLWSLVYEMRLSIVFPLIVLAVVFARRWWLAAAGALILTYVATRAAPNASVLGGSYTVTLRYAGFFATGVLLAIHRGALVSGYQRLPSRERVAVALAGLIVYTYPFWMWRPHSVVADYVAAALGSGAFLVVALGARRVSWLLRTRPMQVLGRVSYSLYLLHALVVVGLTHVLYGRAPLAVIVLGVWPVALGAAYLSERFVEQPGIRVGRTLAARVPRAESDLRRVTEGA